MERYAWKAHVFPGKIEEYKKRHDEIWPEMIELFKKAGVRNYSIWNIENDLFGYYECDNLEKARQIQEQSKVKKAWGQYMSDVMEMEKDPLTGETVQMRQVFMLDEEK